MALILIHVQFFLFVKNKQHLLIYFGDFTPLDIAINNKNELLKEYLVINGYNSKPTKEKESENREEQMNNAENKVHFPNSTAFKNINSVLSSSLIKKYSEKFVNAILPNINTTNNNNQENDDENEEITIQEACRNKSIELLKVLIDKGFDVNSLFKDGETALHVACRNNWKEGVEFLIDKGADNNIFSKDGKLARDLTNENEILEIL